jgi:hypothetical protein
MSELIVTSDSCSRCGVAFLGSENFCRNCGRPIVVAEYADDEGELIHPQHELAVVSSCQTAVAPRREQSLVTVVLENRFCVVAILLCAGPIGLPALWFSPRFSRRFKIITSTGYFLLTAILPLAITWYVVDAAVRPLVDVFAR